MSALPFDAEQAREALRRVDPTLGAVIDKAGPLELTLLPGPWRSLSRAILFQQLATGAARTIMGRVLELLGTDAERYFTPEQLLATTEEQLRGAGVSRQKQGYLRDLARHFADGRLVEQELIHLPDEEIIARVTQVKGVGRWTAEMFLIFSLGRPDVLPVDDFGVRNGYALTFGLPDMPRPAELRVVGERWAPWRSVAAWYLWRAVDLHRASKAT